MPEHVQRTLDERIKELSLLHKTARLMSDDALSEQEMIREVVRSLPAALQHPEFAEARICIGEIQEQTSRFCDTARRFRAGFRVTPALQGEVEVVYLAELSERSETPFLAEERELIESVADMICSYMRHKLSERQLLTANAGLEILVESRTSELNSANAQLDEEVRQHRAAKKQIEIYQARLRRLATELSLAEARERREIASDLHGQVIQEFAFMKMRLQQFRGDAVFSGFERNLEEIVDLLNVAIKHTRQLTFEISPPILYELGLMPALEWLAENFQRRHALAITVSTPRKIPALREALQIMLFKCVQELLSNVVRHANASKSKIACARTGDSFEIIVSDNGSGFDARANPVADEAAEGFGLFSIRERLRCFGGEMEVDSKPGHGTSIKLRVPIETP